MSTQVSTNRGRLFRRLSPTQFVVLAYAGTVSIGATLLRLPAATVSESLSFVDALFMAMSAICVTGLTVMTIGSELTVFGQLVIMELI